MDLAVLRDDMVEGLEHPSKGVLHSEALSVAMRSVPRHDFVPGDPAAAYEDRAYDHRGTTVIAPSAAARLLEALAVEPDHSVLVVGAGVGYTAALAAELGDASAVTAVDLSRPIVWDARRNLARAGYGDVLVECRDGAMGVPEYGPYDRILVEAAVIEPPARLQRQLHDDGRMVLPLGGPDQELVAVEAGGLAERFGSVRFKPLLVEGEQSGGIERNRSAREARELAARAAERRRGWELEWIDWEGRGGP